MQAEQKERVGQLIEALQQLGERCRELFRLKLQGHTFPEIQRIFGERSINTIYTWDSRCRKQLLALMGGRWGTTIPQAGEDKKKTVEKDSIMATSWEHLLGGYATNTLTDEEKRQLFEAALNDQALFDALADEEALKVMLADPEARQRILASLEATECSGGVSDEKVKWVSWFKEHTSLAWAGSIAAVGLALIFGWQMEKEWGPVVSQEQQAAKSSSREERRISGTETFG